MNQTKHYCEQKDGNRSFGYIPTFPSVPQLKDGVIEPHIKQISAELESAFRVRNTRYGVINSVGSEWIVTRKHVIGAS